MVNLGDLGNKKIACLTLDVECDYGSLLDEPRYEGLKQISVLVTFFKERKIPLTCFVQGSILEAHPAIIGQLATLDVEFELHSYCHPKPENMDVRFEIGKGKEAYERFFGRAPLGYRAPSGVTSKETYEILAAYGFKFDSSIFPSIKPGVFNNLKRPTKPHIVNGILEFPFTVLSDIIRIPIALSYITLIGKPYLYLLKTLRLPKLIIFDFHLHNLFRLESSKEIPFQKYPFVYRSVFNRIYKKGAGKGLDTLKDFIAVLSQKGYTFLKMADVYEMIFISAKGT